jgi:hypothetical protein
MLSVIMRNVVMPSVVYAECRLYRKIIMLVLLSSVSFMLSVIHSKCHYAECLYSECLYAEWHSCQMSLC